MSVQDLVTLGAALQQLGDDLESGKADRWGGWLDLAEEGGGLGHWGWLVRQRDRPLAAGLLCRLSEHAEGERTAGLALRLLEASARCAPLVPEQRWRAVCLARLCGTETPFTHRLRRWAIVNARLDQAAEVDVLRERETR